MEREVANPLRMLSAYFITAATIRPPTACVCECVGGGTCNFENYNLISINNLISLIISYKVPCNTHP